MRRNTLLPALLGWATVSGYDADLLACFYPDTWPIFSSALTAVAHSILRIVYHLLIDEHPFDDLDEAYFDQRQRQDVSRRLKQRLERLGYRVQLEPLTSAA